MRIWEIIGWLLLLVGLFFFYIVFALLVNEQPRVVEAGSLTIIGVVVFRGGIHLLKVGAAARVCRELHGKMREGKPTLGRQGDRETRRQGDR